MASITFSRCRRVHPTLTLHSPTQTLALDPSTLALHLSSPTVTLKVTILLAYKKTNVVQKVRNLNSQSRFDPSTHITSNTQLKTSAIRSLKSQLSLQLPLLTPFLEDLLPKKGPLYTLKCIDWISLFSRDKSLFLFFQLEALLLPHLRLLHKCTFDCSLPDPDMLPRVQVDLGAIRFVLKGADIMCPGLTSPGGNVDLDLPAGTPVAVMAQGKEHALAIGLLKLSTQDMYSFFSSLL